MRLVVALAAAAVVACTNAPTPVASSASPAVPAAPAAPAAPFLEGIITSRAAVVYGVNTPTGTAIDSTPAMFVHAGPACAAKAQFYIAGSTRVTRVTADVSEPADTAALVVGAHVVVWAGGAVEGSCPRITAARAVEVRLE